MVSLSLVLVWVVVCSSSVSPFCSLDSASLFMAPHAFLIMASFTNRALSLVSVKFDDFIKAKPLVFL
jgi:hypothetical protein